MSYLTTYGTKQRRFQEGGAMPGAPMAGPAPEAPMAGGEGGGEEQILALAQATVEGDQAAAAELGNMLAPMILQEVQSQQGGGAPMEGAPEEAAPPAGEPVFRRGGKFVGTR